MTFDGYRFLAMNAVKARKDFTSSIFAHLFLLICWNLMARSVAVGSLLSLNINVIHMLEKNLDKVNWKNLSGALCLPICCGWVMHYK